MITSLLLCAISILTGAPEQVILEDVEHVTVYHESGRFGGWPANHGIWVWDNEIVVGYGRGYYKDLGSRHHIDRDKPEEHWLARSLDGGQTWNLENPADKGYLIPEGEMHGIEKPGIEIKPSTKCPGGINFAHPDFAMTVRMNNIHNGVSRFYYSYDRGKNWQGPFKLPNFDTPGTAARTDYLVGDKDSCMIFSTAAKKDGKEGRVFCMRTDDGGQSWQFVSYIGKELMKDGQFGIMPSSVRIAESEILVTQRRREGERRYIAQHRSKDNGKTWKRETDPVDTVGIGNPPSMIKLRDGRICLTYGYRATPYSMCAKLSADGGKTWGPELVLRNDGVNSDMGYPRTVQRADGKIVTVYYFADGKRGPERFIAATIWTPPAK